MTPAQAGSLGGKARRRNLTDEEIRAIASKAGKGNTSEQQREKWMKALETQAKKAKASKKKKGRKA
jgi:hypothetical protein